MTPVKLGLYAVLLSWPDRAGSHNPGQGVDEHVSIGQEGHAAGPPAATEPDQQVQRHHSAAGAAHSGQVKGLYHGWWWLLFGGVCECVCVCVCVCPFGVSVTSPMSC